MLPCWEVLVVLVEVLVEDMVPSPRRIPLPPLCVAFRAARVHAPRVSLAALVVWHSSASMASWWSARTRRVWVFFGDGISESVWSFNLQLTSVDGLSKSKVWLFSVITFANHSLVHSSFVTYPNRLWGVPWEGWGDWLREVSLSSSSQPGQQFASPWLNCPLTGRRRLLWRSFPNRCSASRRRKKRALHCISAFLSSVRLGRVAFRGPRTDPKMRLQLRSGRTKWGICGILKPITPKSIVGGGDAASLCWGLFIQMGEKKCDWRSLDVQKHVSCTLHNSTINSSHQQ